MEEFAALFGQAPTVWADAPGRVNLLGEHTDYNGGFVLPTAIPQRTIVALAPRLDEGVVAYSHALGEPQQYALGQERRTGDWIDYVQGVTASAAHSAFSLSGF